MRPHVCVQFKTKESAGAKASTGICPRHLHLHRDAAYAQMLLDLYTQHMYGYHEVVREDGTVERLPGLGLPRTDGKRHWEVNVSACACAGVRVRCADR